ncbi:hypothetical protein NDU88_005953 [Pleurodeles waltl]|uniref:Uncharacterized protein n=1 Tax=Pleurodeles waltl TaxID=8319 RepID=A0AAV7PK03_PLEWA|nr:hypothetical protein NDU88_005953 [Pleurodeles waltl]
MSRCLGLWALSGCLMLLLLLSGTALAGCLLLSARTAELQGRVSALEEQGCRGSVPGEGAPAAWAGGLGTVQGSGQEEALLALLQPGLDRLLQEKLREGLAKMRTVREAPECNCPPVMVLEGDPSDVILIGVSYCDAQSFCLVSQEAVEAPNHPKKSILSVFPSSLLGV